MIAFKGCRKLLCAYTLTTFKRPLGCLATTNWPYIYTDTRVYSEYYCYYYYYYMYIYHTPGSIPSPTPGWLLVAHIQRSVEGQHVGYLNSTTFTFYFHFCFLCFPDLNSDSRLEKVCAFCCCGGLRWPQPKDPPATHTLSIDVNTSPVLALSLPLSRPRTVRFWEGK